MNKKRLLPAYTGNLVVCCIILFCFSAVTAAFGLFYAAAAEFIIAFAFALFTLHEKRIQKKALMKYMENLQFQVDENTSGVGLNFPLPMVTVNSDGTIIWYNKRFMALLKSDKVHEKHIQSILSGVSVQKLANDDEIIITQYNNKVYQVLTRPMKIDNYKTFVLYLVDRTRENIIEQTLEDSESLSALVIIDNYEDIVKTISESERYTAIAGIEHIINDWVESVHGMCVKYEKDKFYVSFHQKELKAMIDSKFSILKAVNSIEIRNDMKLTLSIGVGQGCGSIIANYHAAEAALDMALGRGGDQVVVKMNDKFKFFGGTSQEVEKRTRVKTRVVSQALVNLLQQCDNIIIMGHKNPDADVIGSAIGLCRTICNLGYKASIVTDKNTVLTKSMLDLLSPEVGSFIPPTQAIDECHSRTLLIILDTHKPSYVEAPRLLEKTTNIVVIDHHRKAAECINNIALSYIEPYASSTAEMVTEMMQYMENDPKLSAEEAEALFAGITLDTKNFTVKTGVRTFEAASFLRRHGVDTISVRRLFQNDMSTFIKKSEIIVNAYTYMNDIAISLYTGDDVMPNVLISQAADELLNISGINASFVLCKHGDQTMISGRSLGRVNVQLILEQLGGGGHMTVAGAQLRGISMEEAVARLHEAIDKSRE